MSYFFLLLQNRLSVVVPNNLCLPVCDNCPCVNWALQIETIQCCIIIGITMLSLAKCLIFICIHVY